MVPAMIVASLDTHTIFQQFELIEKVVFSSKKKYIKMAVRMGESKGGQGIEGTKKGNKLSIHTQFNYIRWHRLGVYER